MDCPHLGRGGELRDDLLALRGPERELVFHTDDDVYFRDVGPFELLDDEVCFTLRLGLNTTYCYLLDTQEELRGADISGDRIAWDWQAQDPGAYSYPLALNGHVFRAEDAHDWLDRVEYASPNELEAALQTLGPEVQPRMASLRESTVVSIPANLVNETYANRHSGLHDVRALNDRSARRRADRPRHAVRGHRRLPCGGALYVHAGVMVRFKRRSRPEAPAPVESARPIDPRDEFHGLHYLRHNQRRQEHLATLGLPLAERTVIEVGAGIGEHTEFFLDRGCSVLTSDGRPENVAVLRERFPHIAARLLDLDDPDPDFHDHADVVYCYGTLYHLAEPERALEFLAERTFDLMLVETCVSFGDGDELNPVSEAVEYPSQALSGRGCRPTRSSPPGEIPARVHATDTAVASRISSRLVGSPAARRASVAGNLRRLAHRTRQLASHD